MRLTFFSRLVVTLAAVWMTEGAHAWGHLGHEVVGQIAQYRLKGSVAERHLSALLHGDEHLATAATWADCVKGREVCKSPLNNEMESFIHRFSHHRGFHYADIPYPLMRYDEHEIGARSDDIVHVLKDAVRTLQHSPEAKMGFTEREAFFLVAHLVGDIHQPLHVGSLYVDGQGRERVPQSNEEALKMSTDGGNRLCVGARSLHGLWDDEGPDALKRGQRLNSVDQMARFLMGRGPLEPLHDPYAAIDDWASESVKISASVLKIPVDPKRPAGRGRNVCGAPDGDAVKGVWDVHLSHVDRREIDRVSLEQLATAGERLARLLVTIWGQ